MTSSRVYASRAVGGSLPTFDLCTYRGMNKDYCLHRQGLQSAVCIGKLKTLCPIKVEDSLCHLYLIAQNLFEQPITSKFHPTKEAFPEYQVTRTSGTGCHRVSPDVIGLCSVIRYFILPKPHGNHRSSIKCK